MPHIRHPYPSDLTDQEWALLGPLLSSASRKRFKKAQKSGLEAYCKTVSRGSFVKRDFGVFDDRQGRMQAS